MVLIWGSSLYGKVDEVPGLGHVATQFGHLYYVPLIPMGSYVVLDDEAGSAPIGLSGKSVVLAYLRAALVVALIVAGFAVFMSSAKVTAMIVAGVAGLAAFGSYMIPGLSRADYSRARQMAEALGMTAEGKVLIDLQYGRTSPEKAEKRLLELTAAREMREAERRVRQEAKAEARRATREEKKAARGSKENSGLRAKAPKRRRRVASS